MNGYMRQSRRFYAAGVVAVAVIALGALGCPKQPVEVDGVPAVDSFVTESTQALDALLGQAEAVVVAGNVLVEAGQIGQAAHRKVLDAGHMASDAAKIAKAELRAYQSRPTDDGRSKAQTIIDHAGAAVRTAEAILAVVRRRGDS